MEKNSCLSKLLSCSSAAFRLFPRARHLTVRPLYLIGQTLAEQHNNEGDPYDVQGKEQTFLPAPPPAVKCLQLSPSSRCSPGKSTTEDDGSELKMVAGYIYVGQTLINTNQAVAQLGEEADMVAVPETRIFLETDSFPLECQSLSKQSPHHVVS